MVRHAPPQPAVQSQKRIAAGDKTRGDEARIEERLRPADPGRVEKRIRIMAVRRAARHRIDEIDHRKGGEDERVAEP